MSTVVMPRAARLPVCWLRRAAGGLALLAALELLASVLLPSPRWEQFGTLAVDPAPLTALSQLFAAAGGAGLLLLARGLWRGSRRAAQLAAGALALAALIGIVRGYDATLVVIEAALAALLIAQPAVFSRGAAVRAPGAAAAAIAGAAAAGYALALAAVVSTDRTADLGSALPAAASWLLAGSWWLSDGHPLALALHATVALTLGTTGWWLHGLLRPGRTRSGHPAAEHERAGAIVTTHASDSLDPFALREDKSYHFAHGGLLAYRTVRETAVVSGDPIGPPGSAPAILASFEADAAARGWGVVVTAASARHLAGYRALGLRALRIGEEGVVDTAGFSLDGPAMKTVRKAVRRVERHGWSTETVAGRALAPETVDAIARLEHAWRSSRPRLQGFAMTLGRLDG